MAGNTSNTAINSLNDYCQYRLPCGYCEKLGRDCPKQGAYGVTLTGQVTTATPHFKTETVTISACNGLEE